MYSKLSCHARNKSKQITSKTKLKLVLYATRETNDAKFEKSKINGADFRLNARLPGKKARSKETRKYFLVT